MPKISIGEMTMYPICEDCLKDIRGREVCWRGVYLHIKCFLTGGYFRVQRRDRALAATHLLRSHDRRADHHNRD